MDDTKERERERVRESLDDENRSMQLGKKRKVVAKLKLSWQFVFSFFFCSSSSSSHHHSFAKTILDLFLLSSLFFLTLLFLSRLVSSRLRLYIGKCFQCLCCVTASQSTWKEEGFRAKSGQSCYSHRRVDDSVKVLLLARLVAANDHFCGRPRLQFIHFTAQMSEEATEPNGIAMMAVIPANPSTQSRYRRLTRRLNRVASCFRGLQQLYDCWHH